VHGQNPRRAAPVTALWSLPGPSLPRQWRLGDAGHCAAARARL